MSTKFAYVYWALLRLFRFGWKDSLTEWKALAVICVAQVMFLCGGIGLMLVRLGRSAVRYWQPWVLTGAVAISVLVVALNIYIFRYRKILSKKRLAEFEAYPLTTRVVKDILTGLLLIGVLAFTMCSLRQPRYPEPE